MDLTKEPQWRKSTFYKTHCRHFRSRQNHPAITWRWRHAYFLPKLQQSVGKIIGCDDDLRALHHGINAGPTGVGGTHEAIIRHGRDQGNLKQLIKLGQCFLGYLSFKSLRKTKSELQKGPEKTKSKQQDSFQIWIHLLGIGGLSILNHNAAHHVKKIPTADSNNKHFTFAPTLWIIIIKC